MLELRFAARRLLVSPGFLLTAVITLALGIGATALMFSAVHGLLVRPLPFPDAERLAWIMARPADGDSQPGGVWSDDADALVAQVDGFERMALIGDMGLVRELDRRHDRWRGIWATRGLLEVLGGSLAAGAIPDRIDPAGPKPFLMAYERWQQDFASDPSIIGREIQFADNKRFVVAGVLPRGLEFPFARPPHTGNGAGFVAGRQDFWILHPDEPGHLPAGIAIARLRRGRSMAQVSAQVKAVSDAMERRARRQGEPSRHSLQLLPMRDQVLGGLRPALLVLQTFAILVLLVACANLATLLLARAVTQRGEIAIRVALGAGPRDLTRMFIAEAFVVCVTGSALGLALAVGGRTLLGALAPRHQALIERISIDWMVLLVVASISVVTTALFGIVPGWIRARAAVAEAPDASTRHTPPGVQWTFRTLVIAQISLSLTLLVGAAALRDSFNRIMHVDAGYDMRGVVAADILLFISMKEAQPLIDDLVTRLRAAPGISAVGLIHSTPLTGKWTFRDELEVLEGPRKGTTPPVTGGFVAYDYFTAMGVPLLAGREFTKTEFTRSAPRVLIINDVAARTFFPEKNPVGSRVKMNNRVHEIVGVVKGTRDARLDLPAEPQWYQPAMLGSSQVIVRGTGDSDDTIATVRRELAATDSRLIVERLESLEAIASDTVIERRLASQIVSTFALVAMALAAVGLYGVMHFGAMRRQREFGIRLAIGATPSSVLRMVLRQGLAMTGIGVTVGIALSVAAAGALQAVLFEARAARPGALASAAVALVVVAIIASLGPAWRAATVDPALSLRSVE